MQTSNYPVPVPPGEYKYMGRVSELSDTRPTGEPYEVHDIVLCDGNLYVYSGEWNLVENTVPDVAAIEALAALMHDDQFVLKDSDTKRNLLRAAASEIRAIANYYKVTDWELSDD